MRAAVITAPRSVAVTTAPVPAPAARDVLVCVDGTGVCGSNLPVWQGRPWFGYPLEPGAPGHEAWGSVEAIGSEVTEVTPGDRVALLSTHAFAEYDMCSVGDLVRLPADFRREFPGEPLACAVNAFHRAGIVQGNRVAVVGVGFLGAVLVALAHSAGAAVTAFSRREFARDVASRMGADRTIPFSSVEQARHDAQRHDAEFDCVIEAVGTQEALDLASELPRVRGRLVIAGYHQDGPRSVNMQSWNWRGIDVINAHERDPREYLRGMQRAVDLVSTGALDPSPLFTHRVPLDSIGDALELLDTRPDGFMKALVMM
jgi:NADPH2:quinone reductase